MKSKKLEFIKQILTKSGLTKIGPQYFPNIYCTKYNHRTLQKSTRLKNKQKSLNNAYILVEDELFKKMTVQTVEMNS